MRDFYGECLKRLDDGRDECRLLACGLLKTIVKSEGVCEQFNELDSGHHEHLIGLLLIHLDDASAEIREGVASILREFKNQDLIKQLAEKISSNFRHFDSLKEFL